MNNIRKMCTACPKIRHESKTDIRKKSRSLHGSLKWVLFLAQCFGQMPVLGIAEEDPRFLKFSWKSWKTIYCILNCVGSGFLCGLFIYRIVVLGGSLYDYSSLAFYLDTLMVTVFFLKLATEWSQLMHKWAAVEFSMRGYGWPQNLHTRITIMSIVVLTLAAVETAMVKSSKLYLSMKCTRAGDGLVEHYFKMYMYPEIFETIDYTPWKAILVQIVNYLGTFAWTFNDLFIMLMSTALAVRFKQITARLKLWKTNSKGDNLRVWREIRNDYNRLAILTKDLDEAISYITITSFAGNLLFILLQLFNSIRKMRDTLEKVYFFFSFAFLILRTVCVSLYGAWIYDESKEPLVILNAVPSSVYNIELKRLSDQIKFDTIALTGKSFFYVTRGLILSMAGAIVTYELVLIQFNGKLLQESEVQAKNSSSECKF